MSFVCRFREGQQRAGAYPYRLVPLCPYDVFAAGWDVTTDAVAA